MAAKSKYKSNGKNNDKPLTRRGKTREQIKEHVLKDDPLRDYHATGFKFFGELFVQQLPQWRLWTGRMMLTSDPVVNYSLAIRNAALMPAEIVITAKNPIVKQWVQDQWDYLWNQHRAKLCSAKKWGFAPLQVLFKMKDNLLCIRDVRDYAPEDARALEVSGRLCGQRIKSEKLYFPQALWLNFGAEGGSPYGYGCLRRSYPAWYEKWMNHGAKRLLQQRMIKDAYIGDILWYPPNMLVDMPDGTQLSWRDMLREVGENRLSGGVLTMPRLYDTAGKELTGYTPPQSIAGTEIVFQWVDHCNEGIFQGADVPTEVVEAADTGSGYSGRSIPFLVLLSNCTQELMDIVAAVKDQVLRPMAWLNWGGDTEFDIVAKSLVESFSKDTSGSAMGGSALGQPASGQGPPQQQEQAPVKQEAVQYAEEAFKPREGWTGGTYHGKKHASFKKTVDGHGGFYYKSSRKFEIPNHQVDAFHRTAGNNGHQQGEHYSTDSSQHSEEGASFNDKGEKGTLHAPPGGVTIHGVKYKGGEFIPKEVLDRLTPEERSKVEAGSVARHIKANPTLSKEHKPAPDISKAVARRNVEPSGKVWDTGALKEPTPEVVESITASASKRLKERQDLLNKLLEAQKKNPKAGVTEVRSLLPKDTGTNTWEEAISIQKSLVQDSTEYIADIKLAGELYKHKTGETTQHSELEDTGQVSQFSEDDTDNEGFTEFGRAYHSEYLKSSNDPLYRRHKVFHNGKESAAYHSLGMAMSAADNLHHKHGGVVHVKDHKTGKLIYAPKPKPSQHSENKETSPCDPFPVR